MLLGMDIPRRSGQCHEKVLRANKSHEDRTQTLQLLPSKPHISFCCFFATLLSFHHFHSLQLFSRIVYTHFRSFHSSNPALFSNTKTPSPQSKESTQARPSHLQPSPYHGNNLLTPPTTPRRSPRPPQQSPRPSRHILHRKSTSTTPSIQLPTPPLHASPSPAHLSPRALAVLR